MTATSRQDRVLAVTSQLSQEGLWDLELDRETITFRPVPEGITDTGQGWRVQFDLAFNTLRRFGLDILGEVMLGRGDDGPAFVGLDAFDADELGVSRQHLLLRPDESKLYILDLGSTNGTWINGRSIGVNTPYSIANGDLLTIGKLELVVRILKRPERNNELLQVEADLVEKLAPIARAITAQLRVKEVLHQALETVMSLASVDEASIWLVDEQTGELFLEAEHGIESEQVRRMRLSVKDSLPGKVIATGKPVRANRQAGGNQIKVKTGYLVEAVIYVPLTLGGVTFGVLSAAHRADGKQFSEHEERLMALIAEFTAVAVQNARLYQATDRALTRRTKAVTALNYTLSYDMRALLNQIIGYAGLLEADPSSDLVLHEIDHSELPGDIREMATSILASANSMATLVEQMVEFTTLSDGMPMPASRCDLLEAVQQAVTDQQLIAADKRIHLRLDTMGMPYFVLGNTSYLYRTVLALVQNAVKFTPVGGRVTVTLAFGANDIVVRVADSGPGIPEEDIPHLFNKYFRSGNSPDGKSGIGLGLELVRATVAAHKGTITVQNTNPGVEFIIALPASLRAPENGDGPL